MALIERGQLFIGVEDNGVLQIRRTRIVIDDSDGTVIGERHHREMLKPGQDVSTYGARIRRVAEAVWTPQVIADYRAANGGSSQ